MGVGATRGRPFSLSSLFLANQVPLSPRRTGVVGLADMGVESILGLDNIRLDLPVAGLGSRALAAFLDYLALAVLLVLWTIAVAFLVSRLSATAATALFAVGVFLLDWGYFASFEIATGGRTLGKLALKLRVVTAEGGSPGAGALLTRNL